MIEIFNQQNIIGLNLDEFQLFSEGAIKIVPENVKNSVSILFTSDNIIQQLNYQFRGKKLTTDVLSFPNETDEFDYDVNHLGDIIISAEQAQKQAIENNLSLELEIKQLILHGIIHLCGYDHETDNGEMNELELKLRDKLGINY